MASGYIFCVPLALLAGVSALTPHSHRERNHDDNHSGEDEVSSPFGFSGA